MPPYKNQRISGFDTLDVSPSNQNLLIKHGKHFILYLQEGGSFVVGKNKGVITIHPGKFRKMKVVSSCGTIICKGEIEVVYPKF